MKLKYKSALLSVFIIVSATKVSAQIKIGEKYQDVELNHVINYPAKSIRLSDFKSKLIILNFWGVTCSSCISFFPTIDSLQAKYKDKIQIVMVNKESQDSTLKFFSARKRIKIPKVPLVTDDVILQKYFPHAGDPFVVWIDSTRTVWHLTDGVDLTAKNLDTYFAHGTLNFFERHDAKIDLSKPLIVQDNGILLNKVDYYSYLMHYPLSYDAGNGIEFGRSGLPVYISCNGASIYDLFKTAYEETNKHDFYYNDTFVFNVGDVSKYSFTDNSKNNVNQWRADNEYDYQLLIPDNGRAKLFKFMKQDLARYFNVDAKIEKKMIRCLALVRTSNFDKIKSKGGIPKTNFFSKNVDSLLFLQNNDFDRVTVLLENINKSKNRAMPLLNETGYTGRIDIRLNKDDVIYYDLPKLKKDLKKYDLDIIEVKRLREVLVISEPNYSTSNNQF